MIRVAYIELDTHAEIASQMMDLTKDSKIVEVDYFFSSKILSQLGISPGPKVHLSSKDSLIYDLSRATYDVVLIGTVHRYFSLFREVQKKFNTYLIVHNLNFTERSAIDLFFSFPKKDFSYRLKLLLKEGLLRAPILHRVKRRLLTLDQDLALEPLRSLPLFYTKYEETSKEAIVKVVIPGTVSQERRDYKDVFKKLSKEFQNQREGQKRKLQIVFLGKCSGKELSWLQKLEEQRLSGLELIYFTHRVSNELFQMHMRSADVLWSPVKRTNWFFSGKEYYGSTKMTGALGEAISFGKPIVLPHFYYSTFPLAFQESSDLFGLFQRLHGKDLVDLESYSKSAQLSSLETLLSSFVEKPTVTV